MSRGDDASSLALRDLVSQHGRKTVESLVMGKSNYGFGVTLQGLQVDAQVYMAVALQYQEAVVID